MSRELAGKVAIVTGAASGIGRASVARFLAGGASVIAADLNPAVEALEAGAEERLGTAVVDVAVEDDVARLVAETVGRFGRLDIMFNNAGVGGAIGAVTEIAIEDWRRTFAILTEGVFLGIKHAARQMIAQRAGGVIVNTASVAGLNGGAGPLAYSAAKAAVVNITQNAAVELGRHRIRVNAICPGAVFTPLLHMGDEARADAAIGTAQPWPERGQPADIAELALFLASDASRFVTGQSIAADGGLTAAGTRFRDLFPSTTARHVGFTYGTTGKPNTIKKARGDDDAAVSRAKP